MSHTPGPWSDKIVSTIYLTPDDSGAMTVHEITTPHGGGKDFNTHAWAAGEANARLIAQAPILLASCLDLIKHMEDFEETYGITSWLAASDLHDAKVATLNAQGLKEEGYNA